MMLSVFSLLSASDYYTGKGKEDKSFFMLEPVMTNVGAGERAWLPSAISAPLKTSLKLFTGMTPVNFENTAKIQEIQKKVESGAYDASRAVIEAGQLQDADYGVFVNVTKTGSTYQLAISITNLTTGREEATSTVSNITKETDLQDAAINASIITLTKQLGVNLTALGLYTLTNSSDGSLDEQIALAKQEAASYQATIDALNRELAGLNTASALTDQEILAKQAAAETEKQLYEQRQLAAQLKAQRLLEQKQKADEEALASEARSAEASRKLSQLSSQAEEIASQVRALQNKQLSVEERITIIENKKAAYMQIYQQVNDEIEAYRKLADEEYTKGYIDPYDPANYPAAFYQNFQFNKDYQNMLINQNAELRAQCNREAEDNIARTKAATEETLATLLDEIRADLATLSRNTFTLSSVANPEIFSVSSYNVNRYSWNADLIFYMFNDSCNVTSFSLSYEEVTGEPFPALKTPADFEDYAATYDIYDAMFRMGTPFLTLEMDYTVSADDDDYPSCYIISPKQFRITRTTDQKLLKRSAIEDGDMTLQYYPATDMRVIGETVAVNETRQAEKKKEAQRQAEQAKHEEEERKAAQKELEYWLKPELGMGPGVWGAVTTASGSASGIGFDAGLDLKFPGFGLNMGAHSNPTVDAGSLISLDFGIEFDKEMKLFGLKTFPFIGLQLGPAFYTPTAIAGSTTVKNVPMKSSSSYDDDSDEGVAFSLSFNTGIFLPISDRIALKTQYSVQLLALESGAFWQDRFSIGLALYLIEGMSADEFWGL